MRRVTAFLSLVSTLCLALALMPSASAAKPIREVVPSQGDVVVTGQCAFPVLGHIAGREIVTTFTDASGVPVKQIAVFPANRLTLTNMRTGSSITVSGAGSSQIRAGSDGSLALMITGHGPFSPHPLTGEPGIWYLSGRGRATFDSEGNQTSAVVSGRLVDLCPRLA